MYAGKATHTQANYTRGHDEGALKSTHPLPLVGSRPRRKVDTAKPLDNNQAAHEFTDKVSDRMRDVLMAVPSR